MIIIPNNQAITTYTTAGSIFCGSVLLIRSPQTLLLLLFLLNLLHHLVFYSLLSSPPSANVLSSFLSLDSYRCHSIEIEFPLTDWPALKPLPSFVSGAKILSHFPAPWILFLRSGIPSSGTAYIRLCFPYHSPRRSHYQA